MSYKVGDRVSFTYVDTVTTHLGIGTILTAAEKGNEHPDQYVVYDELGDEYRSLKTADIIGECRSSFDWQVYCAYCLGMLIGGAVAAVSLWFWLPLH